LLCVFLVGALGMIFPAHPGLLFYRLWVLASALGLALFAQTIVDLARRSRPLLAKRSLQEANVPSRPGSAVQFVTLGALAVCGCFAIIYVVAGAGSIAREAAIRTVRHEFDLSRSQVSQLLSQA